MKASPFFYGGKQSDREFRKGQKTYDRTMAGKGCFVDVVDRTDSETGEQLAYETYMTFPVREGTGKIYGVLTVDSPRSGDLHQSRDAARMKVLAGLLALTYRAEDMRPMPRSNGASSEVG